jgi:broad specificity phosphatase PhoE
MKHLYFMRHGMSEMNRQGLFSGRSDTPLTKTGIEQCKKAAAALKGVKIDAIVSSPMKRAYDSACIVAEEIGFPEDKITLSDLFMERELGVLEGSDYRRGLPLNSFKGVEHSNNLIARTRLGLEFLNALDADNILVVSHSAVGRALKLMTDPNLSEFASVSGFKNAKIVKLI